MAENTRIIMGIALIGLLSVTLLLALGVLVLRMVHLINGVAHYYLRERRPVRQVSHPVYGRLTRESGLWSGVACPNGRPVRFTVSGNDSAPDGSQLKRVGEITDKLAEVERDALLFLRGQEDALSEAEFEICGLDVESEPDCFALEFVANQDDSCVWRVEFESGNPVHAGFDD